MGEASDQCAEMSLSTFAQRWSFQCLRNLPGREALRLSMPSLAAAQEASMAVNVSEFLLERLHQWGVRRIFGYPGDGINGVFGALQRAKDKIEFIRCRHEEMAAFMASAHAKFTGELGVCIATSGPGAAHLITGLYDARLDHMPVLA